MSEFKPVNVESRLITELKKISATTNITMACLATYYLSKALEEFDPPKQEDIGPKTKRGRKSESSTPRMASIVSFNVPSPELKRTVIYEDPNPPEDSEEDMPSAS